MIKGISLERPLKRLEEEGYSVSDVYYSVGAEGLTLNEGGDVILDLSPKNPLSVLEKHAREGIPDARVRSVVIMIQGNERTYGHYPQYRVAVDLDEWKVDLGCNSDHQDYVKIQDAFIRDGWKVSNRKGGSLKTFANKRAI